jgi:poly(hydroxyalkanoate) granule-associated protein
VAKKIEEQVEAEVVGETECSTLSGLVRKVLLVGMGAMALTQEEVEKFVNKLVERGEIAEQDGKKLLHDVSEKRKKDASKAQAELDKRVEDLLGRMNVPTKADIDALSGKITELSKKVDELKQA